MLDKPQKPANRIDYTDRKAFAFPKSGRTPAMDRQTRGGQHERRKALVKTQVVKREGGYCIAWGVSPQCQRLARDRHELIPESLGGPVETWNCVGICRVCHDLAQKTLGGARLVFTWPGKAQGGKPDANRPGNVKVAWRPDGYRQPGEHGRRRGGRRAD